jgi:hypothetical protein
MKIEVGKRYVMRNGSGMKVVEINDDDGTRYPVDGIMDGEGDAISIWTREGLFYSADELSDYDLMSEERAGPVSGSCLLPEDSSARKSIPVTTGVLDYFPLAIAAVAQLSKAGNDKHNPGEPLHWARGKSTDHADCIGRHLIDRGRFAEDGTRHTAALAWRALALLQEELEAEAGTGPVSR